MRRVINNIRNKPDHHKDRIIWATAGIALVILLSIWMIVGNGGKTSTEKNFFQSFSEDLEDGKNDIPADPLAP